MSNARNLARLIVDGNGDIDTASLDNVPPSNDASALTTGTLDAARIADASIAATKLASGAAASNLGNYVTTVNGSTGAVTTVSSFNGSTGAVTYTAPVTSVNGSTGAVTISAGNMSVDTNTAQTATNYAIGQYIIMVSGGGSPAPSNSTRTPQKFNDVDSGRQNGFQDSSNVLSSGTSLSGTWRARGTLFLSFDMGTNGTTSRWYQGATGFVTLMQRTA